MTLAFPFQKLLKTAESLDSDRDSFETVMRKLTETLSQDLTGTTLKSVGDFHAVPRKYVR